MAKRTNRDKLHALHLSVRRKDAECLHRWLVLSDQTPPHQMEFDSRRELQQPVYIIEPDSAAERIYKAATDEWRSVPPRRYAKKSRRRVVVNLSEY